MWIQKSDFENIVDVSQHCAEGGDLLNRYILERQNLDMPGLLGNCFYNEIDEKLSDDAYKLLLDGGTYTDSNDKKRVHFGLKRVLIHYAWAAYIYRGGMKDTPFSVVQKQSQDSIPVPIQELRNLHDEHRRMAYDYWKMTFDYLCEAKKADDSVFPCFDDCDCPKTCAGCDNENCSSCDGRGPNRSRNYRLKVISK